MVICDSVKDVLYDKDRRYWKELLIEQSYNCRNESHRNIVTANHFVGLYFLKRLIIVKQLKDIKSLSFNYDRTPELEYLTVFGNNLTAIKKNTLSRHNKFQEVNFRNNRIRKINRNAFSSVRIEKLDLSHNQLATLRSGSFYLCDISKLIITHNGLSKIGKHSLPSNLKSLRLDHNNFASFPVLEPGLTELTLSHNKITRLKETVAMESLRFLDLSFNKIRIITDEFRKLTMLQLLNLSNNYLVEFSFDQFSVNKQYLYISLANNWLRNVKLKPGNYPPRELILHGNPWNCHCFDEINKIFNNATVAIRQTKCDRDILGSGALPVCLAKSKYRTYCIEDLISKKEEEFFEKFARKYNYCDHRFNMYNFKLT